jgi:hypothetical protein
MKRENQRKPVPAALERLGRKFEQWRKAQPKPRTRLPEALWRRAVKAACRHGVWRVAQTLRLDYETLRRRLAERGESSPHASKPEATFVEVTTTPTRSAVETGLEIERPDGRRLRIYFPAHSAAELAQLSERLWRAGQ